MVVNVRLGNCVRPVPPLHLGPAGKQRGAGEIGAAADAKPRPVQPCAAAAAGLEALSRGRVEDHAQQRLAALDQGDADRELRHPVGERPRAVDRIDHPGPGAACPGAIVDALLGQPAVVRAGAAQHVVEQGVDLQVGVGHHLARPLVPAPAAGAEVAVRQRAGCERRLPGKVQVGPEVQDGHCPATVMPSIRSVGASMP